MILLTGATGFLGGVILNEFASKELTTLGRHPGSNIVCDLSEDIPVLPATNIVIHAAGKAHSMPVTLEEKRSFFKVNVGGTLNLMKGLEQTGILPEAFVYISSVAVYGKDFGTQVDEDESLAAIDPYGKSKIEAEVLVEDWCNRNDVRCAILRLPLIAGVNPPGNLGAMIQGIRKGYYFNIGGGLAKKSMVLADDVAAIIPKAAEIGGKFNLTDGYHPSFCELSYNIALQLKKVPPQNIPVWLAKIAAKAGDLISPNFLITSEKLSKITSDLTFDDSRARNLLHWAPSPVLEKFKF